MKSRFIARIGKWITRRSDQKGNRSQRLKQPYQKDSRQNPLSKFFFMFPCAILCLAFLMDGSLLTDTNANPSP